MRNNPEWTARRRSRLVLTAATLVALAGSLLAPARGEEEGEDYAELKSVSVLGDPQAARAVAGSAHFIASEELETYEHSDVLRVLRQVPGVYLQDEEGYGKRPNIGIRGSGLDRSGRITLLEDGVLIAPAPYAAPSAYYFPEIQRMHAVEVVKGPAAIALGPRTTGGALNLISTPVPETRAGMVSLRGGEDNSLQGTLRLGDRHGRLGWLVEANRQQTDGFKQLDTGGDTGYTLNDYVAKLRVDSSPSSSWQQSLTLKLGYWEHDADETYLGLTDEDFAVTPYRRYAGSALDHLRAHHSQYQLTWTLAPMASDWDLGITAYRNDFHRNWYKLGSIAGTSISSVLASPAAYADELAWLRGDADSPDDALNLRNNNREYYSQGIQALFHHNYQAGAFLHEMEFGLRVHQDEEDRLQDEDLYRIADGLMTLTTDGARGSQANRVSEARAWAMHLSDRIQIGDWSFAPGVRFEHIELTRADYDTADPDRLAGPQRVRENDLDIWVPGLGVTWQASPRLLALAGINRGFNPPAPGSSADAEESTNFEAGLRYQSGALSMEMIGFVSDYANLVGTCTASTGGNCSIGDQFDGGEATVRGVEFGGRYRFSDVSAYGFSVPLELSYTWTPTADFDTAFASDFEPWGDVSAGDRMPYVPEHQLQAAAGLESSRWGLSVKASYQDETRTIAGSGPIPAEQTTDSRIVFDFGAYWQLDDHWQLTARVENLLDEVYNVARRPAGVRPGLPRVAMLGFRYDL